ncbi:hypothetical protein K1719_044485 [Acacia pycnantha]|nr:hypothetical protein K1719_044485 [Acacia pycnantha]
MIFSTGALKKIKNGENNVLANKWPTLGEAGKRKWESGPSFTEKLQGFQFGVLAGGEEEDKGTIKGDREEVNDVHVKGDVVGDPKATKEQRKEKRTRDTTQKKEKTYENSKNMEIERDVSKVEEHSSGGPLTYSMQKRKSFLPHLVIRGEMGDMVGRSGGIATVWWKDRISVTKIRRERQFLHFHCVLDGYAPFFCTTFYAVPQSNLKRILWEELKALSNMISNPWAIIGDFNDILLSLEKVGGTSSSDERIKLFHDRL